MFREPETASHCLFGVDFPPSSSSFSIFLYSLGFHRVSMFLAWLYIMPLQDLPSLLIGHAIERICEFVLSLKGGPDRKDMTLECGHSCSG